MGTRLGSPLWIPGGFLAGLGLATWLPLPLAPLWVLFVAHAVVIFHLALGLPLLSVGRALGSPKVWRALVVVNLVAVPVVAFVLSRVLWRVPDLQVGMLLVLLAPGVALTLPIIRGAGGDAESVLGITPLLLIGQLLVVPPMAVLLSGGVFRLEDVVPTLIPVLLSVALPVVVAAAVQWWDRAGNSRFTRVKTALSSHTPWWAGLAFLLTAWFVAPSLGERLAQLSWLVPLSIAFLVLMAPISLLLAGLAGVSADRRRAILISSVGRGGIVVAPMTLSLDSDLWGIVPLVVMTQASVEALGLMVYRSISPEIIPGR